VPYSIEASRNASLSSYKGWAGHHDDVERSTDNLNVNGKLPKTQSAKISHWRTWTWDSFSTIALGTRLLQNLVMRSNPPKFCQAGNVKEFRHRRPAKNVGK
jgi:hypothetical protein